jgi:hypothetical protein
MTDIKIGVQLVPQFGDMDRMRAKWMECEQLGVDVLYTCDHFFPMEFTEDVAAGAVHAKQPDNKNFEATTIQAAMAATTTRPEIGCIVHANSYRNPNLMADISRTPSTTSATAASSSASARATSAATTRNMATNTAPPKAGWSTCGATCRS